MSDGLIPPRYPHAGSRTGVRCSSGNGRVRKSAEARCEELRWAEVDSRARAGSLKWRLDTCRNKLEAAVGETKEVRLAAKDALSLKAEVARLEKLLRSKPGTSRPGGPKRVTLGRHGEMSGDRDASSGRRLDAGSAWTLCPHPGTIYFAPR